MEIDKTETVKKDNAITALINKIIAEVTGGLKHGFFRYEIEGDTMHSGRREVIFKAGKSHKFHISPEDIKEL